MRFFTTALQSYFTVLFIVQLELLGHFELKLKSGLTFASSLTDLQKTINRLARAVNKTSSGESEKLIYSFISGHQFTGC